MAIAIILRVVQVALAPAEAKVKARAIASLKIALEKAAALAKLAEAASDKNLY